MVATVHILSPEEHLDHEAKHCDACGACIFGHRAVTEIGKREYGTKWHPGSHATDEGMIACARVSTRGGDCLFVKAEAELNL